MIDPAKQVAADIHRERARYGGYRLHLEPRGFLPLGMEPADDCDLYKRLRLWAKLKASLGRGWAPRQPSNGPTHE